MLELYDGNFESYFKDEEKSTKPWLITFCGDGGDCLEKATGTKLASMLVRSGFLLYPNHLTASNMMYSFYDFILTSWLHLFLSFTGWFG